MEQKPKKSFKKELREWGVFLAILAGIYFMGGHILLQRLILSTGILNPQTKLSNPEKAEYDFDLISSEGKTLHFSELRGKVVFMNLWATWCPPCIAEMPNIHSLYQEMASEQIVFVMLSLDEDPEKAREFVKKKGYSFPIYFLKNRLPSVYDTQSIPTTFVISPQGQIASKNYGMANYNTKNFKDFLKKLSQ